MSKFTMFGKLIAHPGRREELAALLLEAADGLKEMAGCEYYLISLAEDDPDTIWVSELWDSQEAHAASLQRPDVLATIQRARPLIAGIEPVKLRLIGGKGV